MATFVHSERKMRLKAKIPWNKCKNREQAGGTKSGD